MSGAYPLVFKQHPKYCVGKFANSIPYIALSDIYSNNYIIRATRDMNDTSDLNPVIIKYDVRFGIIDDGWDLD